MILTIPENRDSTQIDEFIARRENIVGRRVRRGRNEGSCLLWGGDWDAISPFICLCKEIIFLKVVEEI